MMKSHVIAVSDTSLVVTVREVKTPQLRQESINDQRVNHDRHRYQKQDPECQGKIVIEGEFVSSSKSSKRRKNIIAKRDISNPEPAYHVSAVCAARKAEVADHVSAVRAARETTAGCHASAVRSAAVARNLIDYENHVASALLSAVTESEAASLARTAESEDMHVPFHPAHHSSTE